MTLLVYLIGVGAGAYLTYRTSQFLSVMAPESERPMVQAMAVGTLAWPLLPAIAAGFMVFGTIRALTRQTPK